MSALPAAVEADDVATSRLRTHVLRSGPLPGCGHSPHLERPGEFAEIVTQFLADMG